MSETEPAYQSAAPVASRVEIVSTNERWSAWLLADGTLLRAKLVAKAIRCCRLHPEPEYILDYSVVLDKELGASAPQEGD